MEHRPATAEDLDRLAEWNAQLIEDEGHRNPMTRAELRERMAHWLAGDHVAHVFAVDGEELAYALHTEDDERVYLRHFFVAREHRRQGHGRAAMEILLHEVWPDDKRLVVDVLAHNSDAYSFWSAIGYQPRSITLERLPPGTVRAGEKQPPIEE